MKTMNHKIGIACVSAISIVLALVLTGCGKGKSSTRAKAVDTSVAISNKLAAIAAAGEPVTLKELNNWYVEPPASENAAKLYAQAFSALTADDPKSATFLSKNQKALALLLQAAERKSCRYPVDLQAGFSVTLPHLPSIKKCALLLESEAVNQASQGRADAATKAILAGVRLARSLENEPILISRLVEIASMAITIRSLEQALTSEAFTEDQIARLQAALREAEGAASLRRALAGERCFTISCFQTPPGELTKLLSQPGENAIPGVDLAAYPKTPAFQQDFEFALDYLSNLLAVAEMPFPQSLDADSSPKLETAINQKLVFSATMLPALTNLSYKEAGAAARLRVARTALAVERYRLEHANALPGSLSELTPALIEAVPADPFDGRPLRYQKLPGKGYDIYSIGMNRKDDHGSSKSSGEKKPRPLDVTFTVER